jgi:tRNA-binding protein
VIFQLSRTYSPLTIHHSPSIFVKKTLMEITWNDFEKIDIRAGTIIEVNEFPGARKPAYKLLVDFGESGIKRSSAQITAHYSKEELLNRQVIAVVNFPPKQVATFISECLILGVYDENKDVILLQPGKPVTNGMKIG